MQPSRQRILDLQRLAIDGLDQQSPDSDFSCSSALSLMMCCGSSEA